MNNIKMIGILAITLLILAMMPYRAISQSLNSAGFGLSGNGSGGSGTVNSGTAGQLGYYATTSTAISPLANLDYGATVANAFTFFGNTGLAIKSGSVLTQDSIRSNSDLQFWNSSSPITGSCCNARAFIAQWDRIETDKTFLIGIGSGTAGTNDVYSHSDTTLTRAAAGVWAVGTTPPGGSNPIGDASGAMLSRVVTAAKTANYPVVANDSGAHFDNTGASGEVDFSLPAAASGLRYCFAVYAAQTLKVIANGTDKIAIAASNSAAGGNATANALYASLCIEAHGTGQWIASATPEKAQWTVN
jgi:hypothetical protein